MQVISRFLTKAIVRVGANQIRRIATNVILAIGLIGVVGGGVATMLGSQTAIAATGINHQINFQGKIVNTDGTNISNGTYAFTFKLYSVSTGGTAIWTETKSLAVTDGVFQTQLGDTTSLPGSVDFNTDSIYLGINFNPGTGYDGEMAPRIQFTAAAYAFNSEKLGGIGAAGFAQINPSSAQAGSLNLGTSVQAGTSLQAPLVDTATAGVLSIGTGTATSVTVGRATSSNAVNIQGSSSSTWTVTGASGTTTVNFVAPTSTNTISFPNAGGTICTTVATTCSSIYQAAGGPGGFIAKNANDTSSASYAGTLLGLSNTDTSTSGRVLDLTSAGQGSVFNLTTTGNPAAGSAIIKVNDNATTPTGNLIDLQVASASKFSVNTAGAVTAASTFNGQTLSATASFTGTVTAATSLLAPLVDTASAGTLLVGTTTATGLTLGKSTYQVSIPGGLTTNGNGIATAGGNLTLGAGGVTTTGAIASGQLTVGTQITNNGASLNTSSAISNMATGGNLPSGGTGATGATTTVDKYTSFTINQTTAGQTLNLPTPTDSTAGRVVYVANIGTVAFTMNTVTVANGKAQTYIWNGSFWTATNIDGAGAGVTLVGTLDGLSKSADGAGVSGNAIYLQSADASYAGLVNTGTQTFAGAKTFGATGTGLTVTNNAAVGGTLNVTGLSTLGATTVVGTTAINTTGGASTTIGSSSGAFQLTSTGLNVSAAGVVTGGTYNAQTISSTASFTGTVTTAGAVTVSAGGLTVSAGGIAVTGNSTIAGSLSGITGLTVASGGANITGGVTNNAGGITGAGAVAGVTSLAFTGTTADISAARNLGLTGAISGGTTYTASTSLQAPLVDTASAVALNIGTGAASSVTIGRATSTTAVAIQGSAGSTWSVTGASGSTTLNFAAPSATNTITFPNAGGTVCTTVAATCASTYQAFSSTGYIAKNTNDTSSASYVGNLLGLSNTSTGAAGVLSLSNAGTNSALSVAQSTNPTIGQALILANNTATTPSGNLVDLQVGGSSKLSVNYQGNLATGGTISSGTVNGQTISAAASFTGSVTAATGLTVTAGGVTVTGNSSIAGTLTGLTGLTVASGGENITGNSTISGTLSGLTGLTVASGGETITAGGLNVNSTGITNAGAVAGVSSLGFTGAAADISGARNIGLTGTISGGTTYTASTSLQAPLFDTATAVALNVGTGTATSVTVGRATSTTAVNIQGSSSSAWTVTGPSGTTTLNFVAPTATNTISFPNAGGTVCTTVAATCNTTYQAYSSTGYLAKNAVDTSSAAVTAGNALYALTNSSSAVASGVLSLANGTNTGKTLSVTASGNPGAGNALIFANNTAGTPSGNLVDLQAGSVSKFSVSATGTVTEAGNLTVSAGGLTVTGNSTITGTLTGLTGLTVASGGETITAGGLNVTGGITNNAGGITGAGAVAGVTSLGFTGAAADISAARNIGLTGTISGGTTYTASTSLQAPLVDTATAVALNIGTTTASSVTVGRTTTPFTVQGSSTSTLTGTSGANTTTVGFVTPTSNNAINFPNAGGTLCTTVATTCNTTYQAYSANGYLGKNAADTSSAAITAGNYLYGFTNSSSAVGSGVLSLANGSNTGSTLSVTASGNPAAGNALIFANNTAGTPSGNLADLQAGSVSKFSVNAAGAVTAAGAINGQTISSTASFTGTVTAATSLLAPLVDTASAGTLLVGTSNATGLTLGKSTYTVSIPGGLTTNGNGIATANGNLTLGSGTVSTTGTITSGFINGQNISSSASFSGTLATIGAINGQTISSAAVFTGTVAAATSLQAPLMDTATGVALNIGTGTATAINLGRTSTPFLVQGNSTSTITATSGANTTTVGFTTPTANNSIIFPNAGGTVCTTVASTCSSVYNAAGTFLTKNSADTSTANITAGNYLYGFTNGSSAVASGVLNLSNGTNTGSTLNVTASGNPGTGSALILANNTSGTPSGNLLDLQVAGSSKLSVNYQGNLTTTGTISSSFINGQNISSTASFTGTLSTFGAINGQTISNAASFTGTVSAATSLTSPILTSTGALAISSVAASNVTITAGTTGSVNVDSAGAGTVNIGTGNATATNVGRAGGALTLAGNAGTVLSATSGANTTSVGFVTPTANNSIQFPNAGGTVCTTTAATCNTTYQAAGNYLLQNPVANNASNSSFAGYQYSFTNTSTGAAGNLSLTNSGTSASLSISQGGNPSAGQAALLVNNSNGTPSGNLIDLQTGGSSKFAVTAAGGINLAVGTLLTHQGATVFTATNSGSSACAMGNQSANVTLTASATVDVCTYVTINQTTTPNIYISVPNPSNTTAGRIVYISNTGSVSFNLNGTLLVTGSTASLLWNGSTWTFAGAGANAIANQNVAAQVAASFWIDGSARADNGLFGPSVDTGVSGGTLRVGNSNANAITLEQNTSVTGSKTFTVGTGASSFSGNVTINAGKTFSNGSSTLNVAKALGDLTGGTLGSASSTVDAYTYFTVSQSTTGQTITIPAPSVGTAGRIIYISNIGSASFNIGGSIISTGSTASLIYNGSTWTFAGAGGSAIQNQYTAQQTGASFWLDGIGRADTSLLTPLLDTATNVALEVGKNNASAINLDVNTNIAAGQVLTNKGATVFTPSTTGGASCAFTNQSANVTLTASSTVDTCTYITINQTTTSGVTVTLPSPTSATAGRLAFISNTGSVTFTLSAGSITLPIKAAESTTLIWNGSSWTFAGTSANGILNQTATQSGANFNIGGTGVANILQATSDVDSTGTTLNLGLTSGGNATAINLNQDTTLATGQVLYVANGAGGGINLGTSTSFTNNGSTILSSTGNSSCTVTNKSSNTTLTNTTSVDICSYMTFAQTTASITFTIPTPTGSAAGHLLYLSNTGTAQTAISASSVTYQLAPSTTMSIIYTGSAWVPAGNTGITSQSSTTTAQNQYFNIGSGTGTATSFVAGTFDGTSTGTALQIGATSSQININQSAVITNGKAINYAIGATHSSHTLSVNTSGTAGIVGDDLSVTAGAAFSSGTGAAGGALTVAGGAAAGSGNNAGGAVNINGGAKTGTGAVGNVILQGSNAGVVGIGTTTPATTGTTTGIKLELNSAVAGTAGLRFTQLTNASSAGTNATSKILSVDSDGNIILVNDQTGAAGSGVNTIGALNGGTANANGASISTTTLFLQSATTTNPGLIDTTTQSFIGAKTFTGSTTIFGAGLTNNTSQTVTNNGATVLSATANSSCTLANQATGTLTNTTTVDVCSYLTINQTTASVTVTLPAPTGGASGHIVYISNIGSALLNIVSGTVTLPVPAGTGISVIYTGSAWSLAGNDGVANSTTQQTGNFNINGTGTAATSLITPLLDTASSVNLNIGATSSQINLNQSAYLATGKSLNFAVTTTHQAHAITVATQGTAAVVGDDLTVTAGAALSSGTGAAGGALTVSGGAAAGSGNNAGGAVNINGGAKTGSGSVGNVILQGTNSGAVGIGTTTPATTGTATGIKLEVNSAISGNSGVRLTQLTSGSTAGTNSTTKILSVDSDGNIILVNDQTGTAGSGVNSIGTLDGQTATATGASISTTTLYLQSATTGAPGLVNTIAQSFIGAKTFTGSTTTFNAGITNATSQTITNNGATVVSSTANSNCTLANQSSVTLTNTTTVDVCTYLTINQTTASVTVTLPTPTASTTAGRVIYISDIGSVPMSITASTVTQPLANGSAIGLIYTGTAWSFLSNNGVVNQNATAGTSQTGNFNIQGTGTAGILNATGTNGIETNTVSRITSAGVLQNITGYTGTGAFVQSSGSATFNQTSADLFKIAASAVPSTDMVQITNTGKAVTTDQVNAEQIDYYAALPNAAYQASALRVNITNTSSTSGTTTNGFRLVVTTGTNGNTNGIKIDNITSTSAGTDTAINVGTGWDNILSYNGNSIISGAGAIATTAISGSYTGITGVGALTAGSIGGSFGAIASTSTISGTVLNASTGLTVASAAAAGNFLRGNGTNYVGSAILAADIPTGSSYYVQNQSSAAQTTSNFWISGTGVAAKYQAPTYDAAAAGALNLGLTTGGTATSIALNQNVTIASGKTVSFANSGSAHTLGVVTSATANASGDDLTLTAGAANGSSTGSNGGNLNLTGGAAAGTASNNGGNVAITGGAKTSSGTPGYVVLQGSGGGYVGIGTTNPGNTLEVNSGTSGASGVRLTQLTSTSTAGTSNGKVLTVNSNGDIILVPDQVGSSGSGVNTVGTINTLTKSSDGAGISGSTIYLQTADASAPGLVSTGTQTFAGDKTFNGNVSVGTSLTAYMAVSGSAAVCFSGVANGTAGLKTLTDCSSTPTADYAENYPVAAGATYGDIVGIGTKSVNTYDKAADGSTDWAKVKGTVKQLVKTNAPYQTTTIGIISDNTSDFTSTGYNVKSSDNPMPIALNGRVPVNMDPNSPAVAPGDYITTSSVLGKGTKATGAGYVVGKALDAWDPASGATSVMVFVEPGYYAGPTTSSYIQNGGNATLDNLTVGGTADFNNLNASGKTTISDLTVTSEVAVNLTVTGTLVDNGTLTVAGAITANGGLTVAGLTTVADINVNGHIVTGGTTPTVAADVNAGTAAACTVVGNDSAGQIVITTGTGTWKAGSQCDITFAKAYAAAPHTVMSLTDGPANAVTDASAVKPYLTATATGFQVMFNAADTAAHTYAMNYFNAE